MKGARWTPGIGDPTLMGWLTVAAYFATAVLCWRASGKHRDERVIWRLLAVALILLGINKQLDLQSWFTQVGRDVALAQGWYAMRGLVQQILVVSIAVLSIVGTGAAFWVARRQRTAVRVALAGMMLLLAFVTVRASSFHHVDVLISVRVLGARFNWIFELGGIGIIAFAAWRAVSRYYR